MFCDSFYNWIRLIGFHVRKSQKQHQIKRVKKVCFKVSLFEPIKSSAKTMWMLLEEQENVKQIHFKAIQFNSSMKQTHDWTKQTCTRQDFEYHLISNSNYITSIQHQHPTTNLKSQSSVNVNVAIVNSVLILLLAATWKK